MKYSLKTLHSSPERARYGVSFVSSKGNILCRLVKIELYKIFAIINRAIKGLHCTLIIGWCIFLVPVFAHHLLFYDCNSIICVSFVGVMGDLWKWIIVLKRHGIIIKTLMDKVGEPMIIYGMTYRKQHLYILCTTSNLGLYYIDLTHTKSLSK